MRKAFTYLFCLLLAVPLVAQEGTRLKMEGSFLQPLQERDSVLIADQVFYGFELQEVEEGTQFAFPVLEDTLMTDIEVVSSWRLDTLTTARKGKKQSGKMNLRGGVTITSFEEGIYVLPPLVVQRMSSDGVLDTLIFDPQRLEVKSMPVDTATFTPHDIKGQIRYPVTFKEVLPWVAGSLALIGLVVLAVWLIVRYRRSIARRLATRCKSPRNTLRRPSRREAFPTSPRGHS